MVPEKSDFNFRLAQPFEKRRVFPLGEPKQLPPSLRPLNLFWSLRKVRPFKKVENFHVSNLLPRITFPRFGFRNFLLSSRAEPLSGMTARWGRGGEERYSANLIIASNNLKLLKKNFF